MHEVDIQMMSRMRRHGGRKAQITVFMIVGIILLFSSALLFYIRNQIAGGIPEEFIPVAEDVPLEAQPLKIFVEDCVKKVGKDALMQIGLHGGYIDPNDEDLTGKTFLVGIEPTNSDALALFDNDNAKIPYWWYLKSENDCSGDCEFGTNRPALRKDASGTSIEGQMDMYIEREIGKCLDNFQQFREQAFVITERGPMKSDVRVAEREVLLLFDYPITVEREGRKTDMNQFYTKLDINFREIYEMASEITNSEIQMYFLELHVMNLISMYSWPASTTKIPPVADVVLGAGDYKVWTRMDTQRKIESNILTVGIPMLQIDQSRGFSRRVMITQDDKGNYKYDVIGQGLMDKTIITLNNTKNYTTLNADFTYLDWWPIYVRLNGGSEIVGPKGVAGSDILSFISINEYKTWYDVSFPVLVKVSDPDAFNGEGFELRFALEGNIRENNHTSPTYFSFANDTGRKLACNLNQRNTGLVNIETKDAITGAPVPSRVEFVLGNEACFIGFTSLDADNKTTLSANLPAGWGALRVNNKSYVLKQERFITIDGKSYNRTVELMPYRYMNASVFARALEYDKAQGRYIMPPGAAVSPIDPRYESVLLVLKRQPDGNLADFTAFLTVYNSTTPGIIRLVPGEYEMKGFLFYESETNPIRIPEEHMTYELFWSEDVEVTLNATEFDKYQKGGVMFVNQTGHLIITEDQLFGSSKVVFYVLRFPPPIAHSESMKNLPGLEQLGKVEEYTNIYKDRLQPEWLT